MAVSFKFLCDRAETIDADYLDYGPFHLVGLNDSIRSSLCNCTTANVTAALGIRPAEQYHAAQSCVK